MERDACRARLEHLLVEEAGLLETLEQQLQRERELLTANDVEGLDAASGARQNTVARLLRIEEERRTLCRTLGFEPGQQGLAAMFAWCDPVGSLATPQGRCAELAQRCREQNDRNGALVTARLNRVTAMLDLVAGDGRVRTYDQRAASRGRASPPAGRMVSVSA